MNLDFATLLLESEQLAEKAFEKHKEIISESMDFKTYVGVGSVKGDEMTYRVYHHGKDWSNRNVFGPVDLYVAGLAEIKLGYKILKVQDGIENWTSKLGIVHSSGTDRKFQLYVLNEKPDDKNDNFDDTDDENMLSESDIEMAED